MSHFAQLHAEASAMSADLSVPIADRPTLHLHEAVTTAYPDMSFDFDGYVERIIDGGIAEADLNTLIVEIKARESGDGPGFVADEVVQLSSGDASTLHFPHVQITVPIHVPPTMRRMAEWHVNRIARHEARHVMQPSGEHMSYNNPVRVRTARAAGILGMGAGLAVAINEISAPELTAGYMAAAASIAIGGLSAWKPERALHTIAKAELDAVWYAQRTRSFQPIKLGA